MANLIDGAIVGRNCDGAVMVIESGAISYRLEQKVKDQLEKSGCRILGAVLNKVDIHNESYYGKYGRYSRYGKYGKYGKYSRYERYEKEA
jgi:Mrp family chromosome partitioning ATPase